MYILTVTRGPDQGKQIRLRDGESYTLGAKEGSSLVLTDPKVLDEHCSLKVTQGQPILVNLTASAGTFVGTKRIAKARLAPGSTFRVGDTLLALRVAPKPRVVEEPDPLIGKIVGGYRIGEVVGRGGMGTVYKATQLSLHRDIALKILRPRLARDEAFRELFINEARAAAQLIHPNVVQVYDAGTDGAISYFSMEFMGRGSVEELLQREEKIPWQDAILMVLEAAHGLEFAEGRDIVHRDIKPDNLLINEDGQVKIADLGLSTRGESTRGEGIIGTPHFIPPEQALGRDEVDTRSDIYSLGATFFRMVTGKTVFTGNTAKEIVLKHIKEPPPATSSLEHSVPEELDLAISKMLAKEPGQRQQTARDVISGLEEICAHHGIKGAIIKRGVGKRVLIPIIALLLAAVGVVIFLAARPDRIVVDQAEKERADRLAQERAAQARELAAQARRERAYNVDSALKDLELDEARLPAIEQTYDDLATSAEREASWNEMADKYREFAKDDDAQEFGKDEEAIRLADTIKQKLGEFKQVQVDKRSKIEEKIRQAGSVADEQRRRLAELRANRAYGDAVLICDKLTAETPGPDDPFAEIQSWEWVSPINPKNRVPATKVERIQTVIQEARDHFQKERGGVLLEAESRWNTVRSNSSDLKRGGAEPSDDDIDKVIDELEEIAVHFPASAGATTPLEIQGFVDEARRIQGTWREELRDREQRRLRGDREIVRSTLRKVRSMDPDVIPNDVMNCEISTAIEIWRQLVQGNRVQTVRYKAFVAERVRMLRWVDYLFARFQHDIKLTLADKDDAPLQTLDIDLFTAEGERSVRDRLQAAEDDIYELHLRRKVKGSNTRRLGKLPMNWIYHACFLHEGEARWKELTPVLEFALGAFCFETMQYAEARQHFARLVDDERYGAASKLLGERAKLEHEACTEYLEILEEVRTAQTSTQVEALLEKLAKFGTRHAGTLFYVDVMRQNSPFRKDIDHNVVPDLPKAPPRPS